ncbi:hypothetical protein KDA_53020 [Dictyobacter alpinus]|uniref:Uncharacterized protein n=1 Tax=Dictyobacter alpinus TaxID=2014873 RepID=A0A402BEJ7_9CHLR|nr:hypothetical protein [Dictyobacter alpinus]GCE29818.1 hypothetical protein KDA_53020 [Dictyobacter alpinus]
MGAVESWVIRTGSSQPPPVCRQLHAGPLIVTLEEGALRSLRLHSQEVLRGLYVAVRDHNWSTITPRFLSYEVDEDEDAFQVRFSAEYTGAEVDFVGHGTINGSRAGEITFTFDGWARRTFRKNRIGFCILHPMELAGTALEVETPTQTLHSVFPEHIAPHQPFKDIVAMRYVCSPAQADGPAIKMELRFDGELFEMEDQRNWTDASYKTYCTPLHLPYPVELAAGEHVTQSITLRPLSYPTLQAGQTFHPTEQLNVKVSTESAGALPALGFGLAQHAVALSPAEIDYLRALRPAYLWLELNLARPDWEETLSRAWNDTSLLQTELELSVVCDAEGQELNLLFSKLGDQRIAIVRLCCFERSTHVTTRAMLEQARVLRSIMGLDMQLGAGSRANFAEFNRADLPLDLAKLANYPINPQVHAFDNLSLVETLQAQAVTVSNAQRIAPGLPLSVGPVTLKPRFNAAAIAPENPQKQNSILASVDPRQRSLFGAGWTVGSLHHLTGTGAHWLTYYETIGWRGLLEQEQDTQPRDYFPSVPGALFPLYHVFADVAEFHHGDLLAVELSNAVAVEALALRQERRVLCLVANLTQARQSILLTLPNITQVFGRVLDETTAQEAMYAPAHFRQSKWPLESDQPGQFTIDLLPYAILRVEGMVEDKE